MQNLTIVSKVIPIIFKVIDTILMIAWPFFVIYLAYQDKLQLLGMTLLAYFALRLVILLKAMQHNKKLIIMLTIIGVTLATLSLVLKSHEALLYYPSMVSMTLLSIFGYSLYKPPSLIEQLARLQTPNLTRKGIEYTYRVTQVWCLFFIFNGGISLLTIWWGDLKLWAWWNGFISYCLMGTLFIGEWCIRKRVQHSDSET